MRSIKKKLSACSDFTHHRRLVWIFSSFYFKHIQFHCRNDSNKIQILFWCAHQICHLAAGKIKSICILIKNAESKPILNMNVWSNKNSNRNYEKCEGAQLDEAMVFFLAYSPNARWIWNPYFFYDRISESSKLLTYYYYSAGLCLTVSAERPRWKFIAIFNGAYAFALYHSGDIIIIIT